MVKEEIAVADRNTQLEELRQDQAIKADQLSLWQPTPDSNLSDPFNCVQET